MKTLADRLNSKMLELDMTQEELAKKVKTSQVSIQKVLSGKTLRPRNLLEIAKAVGTTPQWLVYGDEAGSSVSQLPIADAPTEIEDKTVNLQEMQEAMEFAKLWLELPPDQRAVLKSTAQAFIHSTQKQADKVA